MRIAAMLTFSQASSQGLQTCQVCGTHISHLRSQDHEEALCHSTCWVKCTNWTKHLALSPEWCPGWGHREAPQTYLIPPLCRHFSCFYSSWDKETLGSHFLPLFLNSPNPYPTNTPSIPASVWSEERYPLSISKLSWKLLSKSLLSASQSNLGNQGEDAFSRAIVPKYLGPDLGFKT